MLKRNIAVIMAMLIVFISAASVLIHGTESENNASVFEIRNQIYSSKIAVAHYNNTNGLKLFTGDGFYQENRSGSHNIVMQYTKNGNINDFIRNDSDGVYMTGTYENTALVFYVRETHSEFTRLQIELTSKDEKSYFASMQPDDAQVTISLGVQDTNSPKWVVIAEDFINEADYLTIDYTKCPYDAQKNAYRVVLRTDDGMACFSKIELTGLELVDISGAKQDITYQDGIPSAPFNSESDADYIAVSAQMESEMFMTDSDDSHNLIKSFLLDFISFIARITDILVSLYGRG